MIVPHAAWSEAVRALERAIAASGAPVTLGSLKLFAGTPRLLWFVDDGVCVTIDGAADERTGALFSRLDAIARDVGARVNVAKDSRLEAHDGGGAVPRVRRRRDRAGALRPAAALRLRAPPPVGALRMETPTAVVVGASGGVGRALADALARRGFDLVLAARSTRDLEAVAADVAVRYGRRAVPLPLDLGAPDDGDRGLARPLHRVAPTGRRRPRHGRRGGRRGRRRFRLAADGVADRDELRCRGASRAPVPPRVRAPGCGHARRLLEHRGRGTPAAQRRLRGGQGRARVLPRAPSSTGTPDPRSGSRCTRSGTSTPR